MSTQLPEDEADSIQWKPDEDDHDASEPKINPHDFPSDDGGKT